MTTFARIENGTAVEVGVQDYPPIGDDGSVDRRFRKVKDGVSVGWATSDGGKTWREPESSAPLPEPVDLQARVDELEARLAKLEGR